MIVGGPGTGKTYTAGILLKILLKGLPSDALCRIALAAPTGKAAVNLEASIKRALHATEGRFAIDSKTLQAWLYKPNYGPLAKTQPLSLEADIVLIDECSMIDVALMGRLMEALLPGTRLIMLGDPDQLPAVEAGSLFADMIFLFKENVAKLQSCLRTESRDRAPGSSGQERQCGGAGGVFGKKHPVLLPCTKKQPGDPEKIDR